MTQSCHHLHESNELGASHSCVLVLACLFLLFGFVFLVCFVCLCCLPGL